jgi:hypothetical protein
MMEVGTMTREEVLRQEIDKYKRKVETYQSMISEWESELGVQPSGHLANQASGSVSRKPAQDTGDPLALIQGMIFFNKSQSEAAKTFLEMVGYPLKTALLLEAVEKGGLKIGGKTATAKKQNFYTILHRSADVGLAAKDTWGLVTWPGVSKKAEVEAEAESKDSAGATGK